MKRKIVSILLSATFVLGAVSLSACANSELEAKIAELETKIAQLEQENKEIKNEYYRSIYEEYNAVLRIKYEGVFNENEEKIYWTNPANALYADNCVLAVLRNPNEYIELSVEDLYFENAESIDYIGGVRPPDYFFTPEYEHKLDDFNQIIIINLKEKGKDKVVDAIFRLEHLYFFVCVEPNYYYSADV